MSRIKSGNTTPELALRSALHKAGLRFRIHRKDLPGKPDIVFSKAKLAVFVHGCFWHHHPGCRYATCPKNNQAFWETKLKSNQLRDTKNIAQLEELGWNALVIWECEIKGGCNKAVSTIKSMLYH